MNLIDQSREALIKAPATVFLHDKKTAGVMAIYLASAFVIFGGIAAMIIAKEAFFRAVIMDYFFPESWHSVADYLINFFFESQSKVVIASFIISSSLVFASLILFRLKEYCSACFEKKHYDNGQSKDFPLWMQGAEEGKLLLLYMSAQSIILAIGYYPFLATKLIASILSILFLFFSFGLDLIAPTFQRHRIKYSLIIKVLCRNVWLTLCFGCLFSLPVLIFSNFLLRLDGLSVVQMASFIVVFNLFFLSLAIPAGTRVASALMAEARKTTVPSAQLKKHAYIIMAVLLCVGSSFHFLLIQSLHHKSQLLKCEYDIHWRTMDIDLPSFTQLRSGDSEATLKFDIEITNPSNFLVDIEESTLSIWQNGKKISATKISGLRIEPGETVKENLAFQTEINARNLSQFNGLLNGWRAELQYELLPGLPFIFKMV